ncbi:MAG: hypothetical protein WC462_04945 [archaeon]
MILLKYAGYIFFVIGLIGLIISVPLIKDSDVLALIKGSCAQSVLITIVSSALLVFSFFILCYVIFIKKMVDESSSFSELIGKVFGVKSKTNTIFYKNILQASFIFIVFQIFLVICIVLFALLVPLSATIEQRVILFFNLVFSLGLSLFHNPFTFILAIIDGALVIFFCMAMLSFFVKKIKSSLK